MVSHKKFWACVCAAEELRSTLLLGAYDGSGVDLTVTDMTMRRMWQLLPGRHWPMLPSQEVVFVERITELADGKKVKPVRDDLIMLLTALRCGTDADLLIEHAPGTDPASLLACYKWIDGLRARSFRAWEAIESSPSIASVHRHAPEAVKLLPIPVRRIVATIEGISTGTAKASSLPEAIADASAQMHRVLVRARGYEAELDRVVHGECDNMDVELVSRRAAEVGQRLYDPLTPGIYGDAFYLADRVATLSPLRVRDLLGERHVHTQLIL
jgi:hypothetical protein